jgi:hypothetical protein
MPADLPSGATISAKILKTAAPYLKTFSNFAPDFNSPQNSDEKNRKNRDTKCFNIRILSLSGMGLTWLCCGVKEGAITALLTMVWLAF